MFRFSYMLILSIFVIAIGRGFLMYHRTYGTKTTAVFCVMVAAQGKLTHLVYEKLKYGKYPVLSKGLAILSTEEWILFVIAFSSLLLTIYLMFFKKEPNS